MATINASSASNWHIQTAIDSASDGDTVVVPADTKTWTGDVTIPNTKGIALIGAGIGSTNITMSGNGLYLQTSSDNSPARISGFSLIGGPGGTTSGAITVNNLDMGAFDWRIDHVKITDVGHANPFNGIVVQGYTWGLIDHCQFVNTGRGVFIQMGLNSASDPVMWGDYSWTQDITIGGPDAVYVEDCTFDNDWDNTSQAVEGRWGARYVCRNNTIDGYEVDTHSGCTNYGRNSRWVEIYENTITGVGIAHARGIHLRGSNGVVFNNTIEDHSNGVQFDYEQSCIECSGWDSFYPEAYPAQDQFGAGKDTGWRTAQTMNLGLWAWNNTLDGSPSELNENMCSGFLVEDRDYFNSAKSGYTAYTYPHPLQGEAEPEVSPGTSVQVRMA